MDIKRLFTCKTIIKYCLNIEALLYNINTLFHKYLVYFSISLRCLFCHVVPHRPIPSQSASTSWVLSPHWLLFLVVDRGIGSNHTDDRHYSQVKDVFIHRSISRYTKCNQCRKVTILLQNYIHNYKNDLNNNTCESNVLNKCFISPSYSPS